MKTTTTAETSGTTGVIMADKKKPFGFEASYELFNTRGERLRNVLLIENPGSGQTLQLDIVNTLATETITLNTLSSPSTSAFHFHLHFAAGAAADRVIGVLGEDWKALRVVDAQGTHVYLAWCSPSVALAPGDRLVVELRGVSSGAQAGTEVTLHFAWLELDTQASSTRALSIHGPGEGDYELEYNLVLGVRNRRGRPDIPLRAHFVGPNQVLNVDNAANTLTLRLFNSASVASQEKLRFRLDANQPALTSRLVVALPIGTAADRPWALGTKDQVNGMKPVLAGWAVSATRESADGSMLEWELTPTSDVEIPPQAHLDVTLSPLVTAHPSGTANLELRYSAVAGYWDGEIVCPIEKAPLVFGRDANQANVGIGNGLPAARLSLSNGPLRLHNAEVQNVGPLVFRSDVDNTSDSQVVRFFKGDAQVPMLELNSERELILGNAVGRGKLTIKGHPLVGTDCLLWVDSRSGTSTSVRFPGNLILSAHGTYKTAYIQAQDDTQAGDIALQLRTQKEGKHVDAMLLTAEGRVKDKTGFLVPVGTIVAYGGSAAPEGWLLCLGQEVLRTTYAELFAAIGSAYGSAASGKFRVPTLGARVPIGAYGEYKLGQTGGEFTVALTTAQMPVHQHGVNDPGHKHDIPAYQDTTPDSYWGPYYSCLANPKTPVTATAKTGITIANAGSGHAHNNMQPYTVVNYIIKY